MCLNVGVSSVSVTIGSRKREDTPLVATITGDNNIGLASELISQLITPNSEM